MDVLDSHIAILLIERIKLAQSISRHKKLIGLEAIDDKREMQIQARYYKALKKHSVKPRILALFRSIIHLNPKIK
jgi:chorismate mutase